MTEESKKGPYRESRFAAGMPAVVWQDGKKYDCLAHNLSRHGVLLVGNLPKPENETLEFSLSTPHGDITVNLVGKAVRVEENLDGGEILVGLALVDPSDEARALFETILSRAIEGHSPAPLEKLKRGATLQEIRKALDLIPVPHRVALAVRANPRERNFLREDTNPKVLESLSRNPNLIITEARDIAKSEHLMPTTLQQLANDPRWKADLELKMLILTHKRVPFDLARRLIEGMDLQSLKTLAQRPGINPTVRTTITQRLARGR